jgi:two-component sensor histidine kinase
MRHLFILLTVLIAGLPACLQPYVRPEPINVNRAAFFLEKLKTDTGIQRAVTLTSLANCYAYKAIKTSADIRLANEYLDRAAEADLQTHQQGLYNEIQFLKCQFAFELGKNDLAEMIPPQTDDTTRAMIYEMLTVFYINRTQGEEAANLRKAREYLDRAFRLVDPRRSPGISMILRQGDAELLTAEGKNEEALATFNTLLALQRSQGYPRLQYILFDLYNFYTIQGKYDKALSCALEALQFVRATNDSLGFGDAYEAIGMIFRNTNQLQKALDNFNQAFEYYKVYTGALYNFATSIQAIGSVMISRHEYRQALQYYVGQYEKYPLQDADSKRMAVADISDCYLKLKEYDIAEKYFLQELKIAKDENALNEQAYHRLAFYYIEAGKYKKALPYLDSAIDRLTPAVPVQTKGHLYYMHYLADSALGNYLSAMRFLRANKNCDDTLFQRSRQAEIQRLVVQYETDAKNRQIGLLQKTNELYLANQRDAELIRDISIGTILLVGAVAIIFYRQFRSKKQLASAINEKNQQLEVLLSEKECLLKEVHHRVKNNLHTVISLLDIQAEYLKDDALRAIENSQHRIYAMSLIHQQLYAGDALTAVNLGTYIGELIVYLKECFAVDNDPRFEVDIEALDVDVSIAIPLGLMINEAVTNACKYAFPERKDSNTIGVRIMHSGADILVHVWDNGIGLPIDNDFFRPDSLGFKLIKGLCKEIDAVLTFEVHDGTHIKIRAPLNRRLN